MRVTKLIREYVEKTVDEKMPYPPMPDQSLREEWDTLRASLETQVREQFADFFRKHPNQCCPYYCSEGMTDTQSSINYVMNDISVRIGESIRLASENEYDKQCKEIRKKRKSIIDNILVTLELGGNKADLDAMLANL